MARLEHVETGVVVNVDDNKVDGLVARNYKLADGEKRSAKRSTAKSDSK